MNTVETLTKKINNPHLYSNEEMMSLSADCKDAGMSEVIVDYAATVAQVQIAQRARKNPGLSFSLGI